MNETAVTNKKKGWLIAICIVIAVLAVAFLARKYPGPVFNISHSQPKTQEASQAGAQNYVTKQGSEVDPALKASIIESLLKRKQLFAKGDIESVRQYFLSMKIDNITKSVNNISNTDLLKIVSSLNKSQSLETVDLLNSTSTIWIFDGKMENVRISTDLPATTTDGLNNIEIDLTKSNGVWY